METLFCCLIWEGGSRLKRVIIDICLPTKHASMLTLWICDVAHKTQWQKTLLFIMAYKIKTDTIRKVELHKTSCGNPLGWRLWFWERDLQSREKNKPQSGCKQSSRFWCEDVLIEAGSSVASDSLCVVRMHWDSCRSARLTIEWARRVESHTTAIATWLPTSLITTAKGERGYIRKGEGQSPIHRELSVEHATATCRQYSSLFLTSRLLKQPRTLTLVIF